MQTKHTLKNTETNAVKFVRKYETWSNYRGGLLYMFINRKTNKPVNNIAFKYREIASFRSFFPATLYKIQTIAVRNW